MLDHLKVYNILYIQLFECVFIKNTILKVEFDDLIELVDLKILFKKLFLSYSKLLKSKDRKGLISA